MTDRDRNVWKEVAIEMQRDGRRWGFIWGMLAGFALGAGAIMAATEWIWRRG